mmetsp:Transcript_60642/g.185246  ORF Transcript_60642/g.185246 Transcript_60642/m.185246 type:complete len:218 (-) Transcript_60642:213-866(-)
MFKENLAEVRDLRGAEGRLADRNKLALDLSPFTEFGRGAQNVQEDCLAHEHTALLAQVRRRAAGGPGQAPRRVRAGQHRVALLLALHRRAEPSEQPRQLLLQSHAPRTPRRALVERGADHLRLLLGKSCVLPPTGRVQSAALVDSKHERVEAGIVIVVEPLQHLLRNVEVYHTLRSQRQQLTREGVVLALESRLLLVGVAQARQGGLTEAPHEPEEQ